MKIEINGLEYQQKQKPKKDSRFNSLIIGASIMFGAQGSVGTSKIERENPKVNLIEEYKLIQEKKSNLSRRDREWVIFQFNRNYELISK